MLLVQGVILVLVGVAVTVLTRTLGSPGDVELLVDNIHVLGRGRGPPPAAVAHPGLVALHRRPAARSVPRRRSCRPPARSAPGSGRRFGLDASRRADRHDHRHGRRLHGAVRRPPRRGGLRPRDPAPPWPRVLRGAACRRSSARWRVRRLRRDHRRRARAGLAAARRRAAARAATWRGRWRAAWWAPSCAIAFTYLNQLLRARAAAGPGGGPPRARRPGARPAGVGVALRADLRRGAAGPRLDDRPRAAAPSCSPSSPSCWRRASRSPRGWKGGFIIPLFFIGACLGRAGHVCFPHTNEAVLIAALMVACNVGVTKTPLGSVLVVTEMAGVTLLPTTLIAVGRGAGADVERRPDREPARARSEVARAVNAATHRPRTTRCSPVSATRCGCSCGSPRTRPAPPASPRRSTSCCWRSGATPVRRPTISELAEWLQLRHHSTVELIDRAVRGRAAHPPHRRRRPPPPAPRAHAARRRAARPPLGRAPPRAPPLPRGVRGAARRAGVTGRHRRRSIIVVGGVVGGGRRTRRGRWRRRWARRRRRAGCGRSRRRRRARGRTRGSTRGHAPRPPAGSHR